MRCLTIVITACLSLTCLTGCEIEDFDDVVEELLDAIGDIQTRPQELPPVLIDEGDTIIIDNSVTIIENPSTDIHFDLLPDLTILGFENLTGFDIYLEYYVDDIFQSVYVYDGEVLLLEYPCLEIVELWWEDDVDPFTGVIVDSFDLSGITFLNPEDFFCGEALILTFDPLAVSASVEVVDLVD
jgi:hypothetical protein